ncbi:DUF1798 family protein [Neobacillus notoginsengisoli]|uniref:DUF1798 family protein n=1 Tax=Neobacillus notoginsengisoli TaxID=1578198 RepID=A0A417YVG1_9BACI|nr:DUF1798 family protein [Neobacillus notoginsengisoli]RHW41286.1 DUF1798 family protein [Neobacillus notoginsengisoli]
MNYLKELTEKLIEYNRQFVTTFEKTREKNEDGDFYGRVKPFFEEVKKINDEWKKAALEGDRLLNGAGISQKQIETAHEHIDQLAVQAFFVKTSRYIFMNSSRTVDYTLRLLLEKIREEKSD